MIYDLKLPNWAELSSCPFCGGNAELSIDGPGVFAGCKSKDCWINPITDTYDTKSGAIRAWNRRPE